MKNWQETAVVFNEIARLQSKGGNGALAMIVGLEGSAYRSPGAKLLVREDGSMIGNVSGGCLEGDVMENGLSAMKEGKARLLHYETGGSEDKVWGLGVGCGGKVDVLVIPISAPGLAGMVEPVRECTQRDEPFCLSVAVSDVSMRGRIVLSDSRGLQGGTGDAALDRVIEAEAKHCLQSATSRSHRAGDGGLFTEVLEPPPRLIVCGAGDHSRPVVRLAAMAGFRVSVVDHRPAYLTEARFPDAVALVSGRAEDAEFGFGVGPRVLAIVMFHILMHDKAWVARLAEKRVRYIGLLGSRSRRGDIMDGLAEEQKACVYGPVGLDIGAEGPEQIAISIVAEALAVYSGRSPMHLRDRNRGIHAN